MSQVAEAAVGRITGQVNEATLHDGHDTCLASHHPTILQRLSKLGVKNLFALHFHVPVGSEFTQVMEEPQFQSALPLADGRAYKLHPAADLLLDACSYLLIPAIGQQQQVFTLEVKGVIVVPHRKDAVHGNTKHLNRYARGMALASLAKVLAVHVKQERVVLAAQSLRKQLLEALLWGQNSEDHPAMSTSAQCSHLFSSSTRVSAQMQASGYERYLESNMSSSYKSGRGMLPPEAWSSAGRAPHA